MTNFQGSSKIENILSNIVDNGIVPSSRYVAMFGLPKTMQNDAKQIPNLTIRCMNVTVPGRNVSTVGYRIYGPARQMPYEILYGGEITLTYILSRDLSERAVFEKWMSKVVSNENYKLGFYDDYIGSLDIYVMDKTDNYYYSVHVEEVYPKTIGDLSLSNDRENDYLTQEITFGYRRYTSNSSSKQYPDNPNRKEVAKDGGKGLGLAGFFKDVRKGAGDVVTGVGKGIGDVASGIGKGVESIFKPKDTPKK